MNFAVGLKPSAISFLLKFKQILTRRIFDAKQFKHQMVQGPRIG